MKRLWILLATFAFCAWASPALAHHGGGYGHSSSYNGHERHHRSSREKHEFEAMTGHPHGWPGHVVDHIVPLACGGADAPSNMQWQTKADAKAKDKWERKSCKR